MISMAGEAMVANILQCVESIGEVRHSCIKVFNMAT
jgi:hypothetical protein